VKERLWFSLCSGFFLSLLGLDLFLPLSFILFSFPFCWVYVVLCVDDLCCFCDEVSVVVWVVNDLWNGSVVLVMEPFCRSRCLELKMSRSRSWFAFTER
jgi:hypothetical protein